MLCQKTCSKELENLSWSA